MFNVETQKINLTIALAIALTGIAVSAVTTGLLAAYQSVPNRGNVKAIIVGVFWNEACTENVTFINWGFLEPGVTANFTVYVKNGGNIPIILNMTTENWSPTSAKDYITLKWNCEGRVLNATRSLLAVITLSVSTEVTITEFAFDIIITGTEHS